MRWVIYHFVFLIVLGTSGMLNAGPGPLLPDYESEAKIVYRGLCDRGRINYTTYWKQGGYILEVAASEAKDNFYMLKRYVGENEGWHERYFVRSQDSKTLTELAHEEWDEKVIQLNLSYFNKLHDVESACSNALVM